MIFGYEVLYIYTVNILQRVGTLGSSSLSLSLSLSLTPMTVFMLLHHSRIASSATCTRCGDHEETFTVFVIADILKSFGSKLDFLDMNFSLIPASLIGSVMVLILLTLPCS